MFGFFRKKKGEKPTGNEAYSTGYVSFDDEFLKQHSEGGEPNALSYEYLYEAMTASSNVREKDSKGKYVDIDDYYPVTAEETAYMREMLDKAKAAVQDHSDKVFYDAWEELDGIVDWSSHRHWNFQWAIIIGVIISVFALGRCADSRNEDAQDAANMVTVVENWAEKDTVFNSMDNLQEVYYGSRYASANYYKAYKLYRYADSYKSNLKWVDVYKMRADTATTDERKEAYLSSAEDSEKAANEAKENFDELNKMKFEEVHELALEEVESYADSKASSAGKAKFWQIFFLVLIPVYIFADRPYGYTMSRHRVEASFMSGLKKVGFALAGSMATMALVMNFMPDFVTKWSDGTTTRENNPINIMIMVMKIGLLIAALFVVCVVSCFIMLYQTVFGLIRNYNWTPILVKVKTLFNKKEK